jgi:hypothetical protein
MQLDEIDGQWSEDMWLIWKVEELLAENIQLREEKEGGWFPRDALAFAGAGVDGILFAMYLRDDYPEVFAWYPIEGECRRVASSIRELMTGWISGGLSVELKLTEGAAGRCRSGGAGARR